MRAAILLLCLTTVASASQSIVNDFDPSRPEPLCRADGQFLLHGQNRCKFLRCTYGTEPWQDEDGNTRFYAVERSCPYGTAVSRTAYSKDNSELDERRLCADRVAPHHGGIRYYDPCSVEIPHYPAYNTYPPRYATKQNSKYTTNTESKKKPHTLSKPQYPAYNPYSAHFQPFHYKVQKDNSKSLIERHPNEPTATPYPSSNAHYGHPAAHYPSYPSAYNHHPYPAYISYPAKAQEETEEVEQVVALTDQEEPESENQVEEIPEEEEEDGEVEEDVTQEAEEESAPEEAADADTAAADSMGGPEVMEEGSEDEEGGPESRGNVQSKPK